MPELQNPTRSMVAITGAAGGLGKAFAVECASRGWHLFLTDLRPGPLETLAAGLRRTYGVEVITQACDLTDATGRAALVESLRRQGLRFWSLVNVAGIDFEGPFLEQSPAHIRTIVRLNVEAVLEMTHALLGLRDPLSAFRIINVASLAAFYPMPVKATYAASKRFLLDFSLALREEVRPLGATVTVLCPAGLPTTPEVVQAIEVQGWWGQVTTQNIGGVAARTLDCALAGRAVYIPGWINQLLHVLGSLAPAWLVASLINRRWQAVHQPRPVQAPATGGVS